MSEDVVFKGSGQGLRLIIKKIAYATLEKLVREKLDESVSFFQSGAEIKLQADWLSASEKANLVNLFSTYNLNLLVEDEDNTKAVMTPFGSTSLPQKQLISESAYQCEGGETDDSMEKTLIINHTIRNGQEIIADGSVVINGNVNPGATVIAKGNIRVNGFCRGIVHAGVSGDRQAIIIANHLMPIQIRIADIVARAPDASMSKADAPYPEKAYINEGQIFLEAVEQKGRQDDE